LLSVSRVTLAALTTMVMGRESAATIRYGARFAPPLWRKEVPESAWHPATQLTSLDLTPRLARVGRKGGDDRGSAVDRRRRKHYLLATYGDGATTRCAFCKIELTADTVTVDRFPIPGKLGGRYTRDNIRPACGPCNSEDQGRQATLALTGARA
jgi:5-methylcytosine-specific restriction endonuclease McrA